MRITEIEIIPVKPHNGLVAFASLVLEDAMYLSSIGIYTRKDGGYRITYPTKKVNGMNINYFHPINRITGQEIEKVLIDKYEEVMNYGRYSSPLH